MKGLFIETHSKTGMRTYSGSESYNRNHCSQVVHFSTYLNIIIEIITSIQTHQELVEKECVPGFEE